MIRKYLFLLGLVVAMLGGPPLASAQGLPGGAMPPSQPPGQQPPGQPRPPLTPEQAAQRDAVLAQQQASVRAGQAALQQLTAPWANAPYNGPGSEFADNSPERRQAQEAHRAQAARLAAGDHTPPPPDMSPSARYRIGNGGQHPGPLPATPPGRPLGPPRRGEEPTHEQALRLLGLGGLLDIKNTIRYDGMTDYEAVAGAPDDQDIRLPVGYCTLSAYGFKQGPDWIPNLLGFGFQYCNTLPGDLGWKVIDLYAMKCNYYFFVLNMCIQPQYVWHFDPPGECWNFEEGTNMACGPGRYYLGSGDFEHAWMVRNHGAAWTYSGGTGTGYRDSLPAWFD